MTEYEKDLNDLKEQILKEGDTLVSKRDLLERFCEVDEEYNGCPWNLLQILTNIHILIGEEPCEDAVSREDCINAKEATNGDMIKAMFPNAEYREDILGNVFVISNAQLGHIVFRESWWNSPYKRN